MAARWGLRPSPQRHSGRSGLAAHLPRTCRAADSACTTRRIFEELDRRNESQAEQATGAGGSTSYQALQRADQAWLDLRTRESYGLRPDFVRPTTERLWSAPEYDVAVAGGTLGIFLACALQQAGLRVAVLERGPLRGRAQEWNISRAELEELVHHGVLSKEDAQGAVSVEFNPVRAGFHGSPDVWTRDVLNLGVSPARLVDAARRRFEAAGGVVLERTGLQGVWVRPDAVSLDLGPGRRLHAALLVDAMGHASPVVRQARFGQQPDGVCLVVGSCARGFEDNTSGDVIATASPSQPPAGDRPGHLQYFWEAFPAGSGPQDRTTYMFTYLDAHPSRPSLEALLRDYWELMPQYQGVRLEELQVLRVLHGVFPTYRDSPLTPQFDRVLQVGDASGIQSPLSFGGFGALARHLGRLAGAIKEAVEARETNRYSLALINQYNPGLSAAWMLQRAMSIPAGSPPHYDRDFINTLLGRNFGVMERLGDATMRPFLQDVLQVGPLLRTMAGQLVADPLSVPAIMARVGPTALADWLLHVAALAVYTALSAAAGGGRGERISERLPPRQRFVLRRALEAWQYGSGRDFEGQ